MTHMSQGLSPLHLCALRLSRCSEKLCLLGCIAKPSAWGARRAIDVCLYVRLYVHIYLYACAYSFLYLPIQIYFQYNFLWLGYYTLRKPRATHITCSGGGDVKNCPFISEFISSPSLWSALAMAESQSPPKETLSPKGTLQKPWENKMEIWKGIMGQGLPGESTPRCCWGSRLCSLSNCIFPCPLWWDFKRKALGSKEHCN